MRFFTSLVTLLTVATGIAMAAPRPAANPDGFELARRTAADLDAIIKRAEDKGIDVRGPIPDDYTTHNVTEGSYTFEDGSKASEWVKAQIALAEHPSKKRQWANIGIGMFAQDWCTGQGAWFDNVQYNVQHVSHVNMFSVGISYRGLRSNEHLDFSKLSGSDWCGQYLYSAASMTPTGCWNSQLINCFRLWQS